jgi:hypothetical protein
MPQFIWEGFFSILNVLVPGVVMALFAAYYQNRRKREIQIESKLAINRIDGYEQILSCFYEGQDIHEVSLREEEEAKAILGYFDVETFRYQCPDAFKSEECFDAYYKRLTILQKNYQIYLDDEASQQLNRSVSIYTRIKNWLDAFSDTEHVVDLKVEKSVARKHIDWMYRLVGMMMFSHCTRAYTELDTVVCKQMNRFYLTYRKHRLRKWLRSIGEAIIHVFDVNRNKKGIIGQICGVVMSLYIGKDDRDYVRIMKTVIEIMRYVHFSDRFTPQEYFERKNVPSHKELDLYGQVFMAMVHKS